MKSDYEERQAARQERYEDLAEKKAREGNATVERARAMANVIPFGQPILIGHHSEKRDRNYRERIHNTYGRGFGLLDTAEYYRRKAASVGKAGISSDDSQAVAKLREKLADLESLQEKMKASNKIGRKYKWQKTDAAIAELITLGLKESTAAKLFEKDFAGRLGFPDYAITNNGAEIRRCKARIKELTRKEQAAETLRAENGGDASKSHVFGDLKIEENLDENRVFIFFPGKPSNAIRSECKREGFRWAPTVGAWSRHHSGGALYAAMRIKDSWLKEQE